MAKTSSPMAEPRAPTKEHKPCILSGNVGRCHQVNIEPRFWLEFAPPRPDPEQAIETFAAGRSFGVLVGIDLNRS